jgi:DNA N-6-adenine-methyltransferase (Dam)
MMMIAFAQQAKIIDFPPTSTVLQGKSNEWYTPSRYIEAARSVMGSIDLDPASCELANRTVKAKRYFTKEDNGLSKEWYGNVWLNPPYGRMYGSTGTTAFATRLIEDYKKGNIQQAIILTMLGMYARWFFRLLDYPICYLEEKPIFYRTDGTDGKIGFAACCFYLGPNEQRFIDIFQQFGTIAKRVSTPRHTIATPSLWEVSE